MPVTRKAKEGTDGKFVVMLGNDCQRYMAPDGKMYEAGKKYTVTAEERATLFSYEDDFGVRYFYDEASMERLLAMSKKRGRRQLPDQEEDEVDTGSVKLKDSSGEPVGTVSV